MPRSRLSQNGTGNGPESPLMGERLRARRQALGLSLRELAERLGVSPSLISQVETGRARPSVSTLYRIAAELGVSLDQLLFPDAGRRPEIRGSDPDGSAAATVAAGPAGTPEPVQRSASRKSIRLASGVIWERLTTTSMPNIDFLYVTYEVGGASSAENEFQRHGGHEWGYVLSGSLGVTIAFEDYVLRPGDSISLDSTLPHRLYTIGDEPVHAIWFVLGRRRVDEMPAAAAPDRTTPASMPGPPDV